MTSNQVHIESQSTDWLSGWEYRKRHTISGASGAGTNYQIEINVHYGSGTDVGAHVYCGSECRTDFGDIRFTDNDGSTLLDYWMETYSSSGSATFWVEVSDDLDTTQIIYVYYGNSQAVDVSDGDATFPFFDDFNDDSLDASKWDEWHTGGTVIESGGVLSVQGGSSSWQSLGASEEFGHNHSFEMRAYGSSDSSNAIQFGADERSSDGEAPGGYDSAYFDYYNGRFCTSRVNSVIETTPRTAPLDASAHWSIEFYSSQLRFYHDSVPIATHTIQVPSTTMGLWVATLNSRIVFMDWAFTRKCIDNEPAHGDWDDMEIIETVSTTTTTTTSTISETTTTTDSTTPSFTVPETGSFALLLGLGVGGIIALVVIIIVIMQVRSRPSFGGFDYG
ncbi:MAG: DUF2341 domain-containing protein [Candidatus Thorarchaeota archaeon]